MPTGWISSVWKFPPYHQQQNKDQQPWTPNPQCIHDHCIMDNALRPSQIPTQNHQQCQNVPTSLHAFCNLGFSNRSTLLYNMLNNNASPFNSHLTWSYQPMPTPAAWNVWSNAMHTLHTATTVSLTIKKPWPHGYTALPIHSAIWHGSLAQ